MVNYTLLIALTSELKILNVPLSIVWFFSKGPLGKKECFRRDAPGLLKSVALCLSSLAEAEELYQKRVLTISGICFALLVVGVMCVVAYCKTK